MKKKATHHVNFGKPIPRKKNIEDDRGINYTALFDELQKPWSKRWNASAPDVLLVNMDDAGFGDLNANFEYSRLKNNTPNFDQLTRESLRLTDFHSAAPVCTPSRAALLTGRHALRYGMQEVLLHASPARGLPHSETTLPEILKRSAGYATMMAGKWHLGTDKPHHPSFHGFDETLTIPYSHDMACFQRWPCLYGADVFYHGVLGAPNGTVRYGYAKALYEQCQRGAQPGVPPDWFKHTKKNPSKDILGHEACPPKSYAACPATSKAYLRNKKKCGYGCAQSEARFSKTAQKAFQSSKPHALSLALHWSNSSCSGGDDCTVTTLEQPTAPWLLPDKIVQFYRGFLARNSKRRDVFKKRQRPVFAYIATHAPHLPYVPGPRFQTTKIDINAWKKPFQPYLDTFRELDNFLGQVLALTPKDAFVIVTSDNGAFKPVHTAWRTGSLGPYIAGGKFTPFEGGHRVIGLMKWPGKIRPGVSSRLCSQLDIFPTLLRLAAPSQSLPTNLDGNDLSPWLFSGDNNITTADHYMTTFLVFAGKKFYAARVGKYKVWLITQGGLPKKGAVYDVERDPAETKALLGPPGLLQYLRTRADTALADFVASQKLDPPHSKETARHASTCCNPKLYDCYCPFPHHLDLETPFDLLARSPPISIPRSPTSKDNRCDDDDSVFIPERLLPKESTRHHSATNRSS